MERKLLDDDGHQAAAPIGLPVTTRVPLVKLRKRLANCLSGRDYFIERSSLLAASRSSESLPGDMRYERKLNSSSIFLNLFFPLLGSP
jgi:hypothetical protein